MQLFYFHTSLKPMINHVKKYKKTWFLDSKNSDMNEKIQKPFAGVRKCKGS